MLPILLSLLLGCPKTTPPVIADVPVIEVETPAALVWPRFSELDLPGDPRVVDQAREVFAVRFTLNPSYAADAGLHHDAVRVPSFTPGSVQAMDARLAAALEHLRALPWDELSIDDQIDVHTIVGLAEEARHSLNVERRWVHRPAEWLEPIANTLLALATHDTAQRSPMLAITALIPGVVDEMNALCTEPTVRDVQTAHETTDGLLVMLRSLPAGPERDNAITALDTWSKALQAAEDAPDYRVIGEAAYAWRLKHFLRLPWTPDELLQVAEAELARVDGEIAEIEQRIEPVPDPTAAELQAASSLDQAQLNALYEQMVSENLTALRAMNVVTVDPNLPPMLARATPDALVPFTGDGGSMNPPAMLGEPGPGYWNVEHFTDDWPEERRVRVVTGLMRHHENGYGPYAVHEGVPGHHLQLASMRGVSPLRTVYWDNPTVEGWGLYAEELFWEGGGYGDSDRARLGVLQSYRFRIRRVVYDVNVETGRWTLQEAAHWKEGVEGDDVIPVSRDILRSIQWPTQLIGYFAGRQQIMELRQVLRGQEGYDERAFNDRILAGGLIPMDLIRAKLTGEPLPQP